MKRFKILGNLVIIFNLEETKLFMDFQKFFEEEKEDKKNIKTDDF